MHYLGGIRKYCSHFQAQYGCLAMTLSLLSSLASAPLLVCDGAHQVELLHAKSHHGRLDNVFFLRGQVIRGILAVKQGRCAREGCPNVWRDKPAQNLHGVQLAHRVPSEGTLRSATGALCETGALGPTFTTFRKCENMCPTCHMYYDADDSKEKMKKPGFVHIFLYPGCRSGRCKADPASWHQNSESELWRRDYAMAKDLDAKKRAEALVQARVSDAAAAEAYAAEDAAEADAAAAAAAGRSTAADGSNWFDAAVAPCNKKQREWLATRDPRPAIRDPPVLGVTPLWYCNRPS